MTKFSPVAKVKMGQVSFRVHQFVHFGVENLQERSDVNEQIVHGGTVGKIGSHSVGIMGWKTFRIPSRIGRCYLQFEETANKPHIFWSR